MGDAVKPPVSRSGDAMLARGALSGVAGAGEYGGGGEGIAAGRLTVS